MNMARTGSDRESRHHTRLNRWEGLRVWSQYPYHLHGFEVMS
jgi:hypothetical protein